MALDEDGRWNFARLMFGRTGTHYFASDLLPLDSADLPTLPLKKRKLLLQEPSWLEALYFPDVRFGRGGRI